MTDIPASPKNSVACDGRVRHTRPHIDADSIARPGPWASDPDRACAPGKVPPDLFFPVGRSPDADAPAIAVCGRCPFQTDCADYALSIPGLQGIWGGTTETDRDHVHRRQQWEGTR